MTHWLAAQMIEGHVSTVETIVGPDGTIWSVGDLVFVSSYYDQNPFTSRIKLIFPGNGCWDVYPDQPGGDAFAVWFHFENGWAARPWLCRKVPNALAA